MCKESVKYYWSEREKAKKSSSLKYDTDLDNKHNKGNRITSTRIDHFYGQHFQRSTSSG